MDELLRRELSQILIEGELRDPRLTPVAAIAITAVRVSPDLSSARVFIDLLGGHATPTRAKSPVKVGGRSGGTAPVQESPGERVLAGLRASVGPLRTKLATRVRMRRVPTLSFFLDDAPERGARIETLLSEIASERAEQHSEPSDAPPASLSTSSPSGGLDTEASPEPANDGADPGADADPTAGA